jgi:hypothetical protein
MPDVWTQKASAPTSLLMKACGARDGKLFFVGNAANANYQYTIDADGYAPIAATPESLTSCRMANMVVGDLVYYVASTGTTVKVYSYNMATNVWNGPFATTTFPGGLISFTYFSACVVGTEIYLYGPNYMKKFNPATNTWTTLTAAPIRDSDHMWDRGIGVLDGQVHVVAGQRGVPGSSFDTEIVDIYDPGGGSWSDGPDYPDSTTKVAVAGYGGVLWAQGGIKVLGGATDIFQYNDSGSWVTGLDEIGSNNRQGSLIGHNGLVYLAAPYTGSGGDTDLWVYEPEIELDPDPSDSEQPTEAAEPMFTAPEPLPYRFSERDFAKTGVSPTEARSLAQRLNANFDAAERQLLALDPNANENRNVSGVDN